MVANNTGDDVASLLRTWSRADTDVRARYKLARRILDAQGRMTKEEREQFTQNYSAVYAAFETGSRHARLLAHVVNAMGPRYNPARVSLDNYRVASPKQRTVFERVKKIAARLPDSVAANESIVFYGTCGTGKDHLTAALLHLATEQHGLSAEWVSGPDFYASCRTAMKQGQERPHIERLASVDIFAMSDVVPSQGELTVFQSTNLGWVIDERSRLMRPTWLTVNVENEDELKDHLGMPVYDRLREGACHILPCFWPSHRPSNPNAEERR